MRHFVAAMMFATPAAALDLETLQLANALGSLLASEEPCGLSYDQSAIQAFISERVDPAQMDFAPQLSAQTSGMSYSIDEMAGSALTAHCAATKNSAKAFGFISD